MKRFFNHTKRPYEKWDEKEYIEEDYEWDETEQSEYASIDEEGYYEEDYEPETGEYYAEEAYEQEESEYYAEEGYEPEESEYYAEEGYEPEESEYYAEEGYEPEEDEYYAEEAYESEESEYYTEEAYYQEEYYEDEYYKDEYYEEEEVYPSDGYRRKTKEKSTVAAFFEGLLHMETMDRIMVATGVGVLILALITGGVYVSARNVDEQVNGFISVGTQLEGITMIGEKGLMAVADAQLARMEAAEIVEKGEEKLPEYNEVEYSNITNVELDMVSIKQDLKIKFTNQKTDKLISNVPFSVTVTDPDGKTTTWSDDDMDGIIYKKGITGGKYKIAVDKLTSEKYKDYILPVGTESVTVKEEIVYEKVDVKNEIKTETQVNAAVEDTKKNETVVESVPEDTVQWVESTVTSNTYIEVAKSTVPDPLTLVAGAKFLRTAIHMGGINNTSLTLTPGATSQLWVTFADSTGTPATVSAITWVSDNPGVVSVDANGMVTALAVGKATVSYSAVVTSVASVSGSDITYNTETLTGTCVITVSGNLTMTLDKTAATVFLSTPVTINATVGNALTQNPVTAESSDTDVATVSVNGRAVTVTGVEAGSATITVKYTENGAEVKATCAVTVKAHPKEDKSTKLLDTSGRQLFVIEDGKYREAVYAHYYTADKFFLRGDAKYTGWQTIEGKVYFFDASGKKVTGDQVIQGGMYSFDSNGALITSDGVMGIDVSKWNGNIDWDAVKNSGVHYVIIRSGYRGSSQGALIEDPKYEKNIKGAIAAGLKVGIYFFTQAIDEVEAVEEASMVLEQIKGYKISYPIFLDVEPSGGRADKIDKATRTAVCKAFCETIQDAGYTAGIYANKTWLTSKIDTSQLSNYKIWLAQYAVEPNYSGRFELWQYSKSGRVSGISGDVDLNMSYLGY